MYQKSKTLKLSPISVKKTVLNSNCFWVQKVGADQTKLDPAALANRPGNWTKQS